MTTTVASRPPARVAKRLRMTRSRTLSSAPPMMMTCPSVTAWLGSGALDVRDRIPGPSPVRECRRHGRRPGSRLPLPWSPGRSADAIRVRDSCASVLCEATLGSPHGVPSGLVLSVRRRPDLLTVSRWRTSHINCFHPAEGERGRSAWPSGSRTDPATNTGDQRGSADHPDTTDQRRAHRSAGRGQKTSGGPRRAATARAAGGDRRCPGERRRRRPPSPVRYPDPIGIGAHGTECECVTT
jgi:hypothetical protein